MFDSGRVIMREMSVKEQRMDQRFQIRWPIHILAADGAMRGETEDISLGGAFIRCEKPLPPDEKVLLTFGNPSGNMQVVFAKVAWKNLESRGSSDKPVGMGIQFMQFLSAPRPREKSRE
jgi:hypothetical protein